MAWYEILLIASSGVFVLTSIVSLFLGGTGLDADGDMDFGGDMGDGLSLGDVISFKGLLHFVIGFSLVLTLMKGVTTLSICFGTITGLVFVFVLYYLYKMIYKKLQKNITYTTHIENIDAEVYFWSEGKRTGEVMVTLEGRPVTITLQCDDENVTFKIGQRIKVSGNRKLVFPII